MKTTLKQRLAELYPDRTLLIDSILYEVIEWLQQKQGTTTGKIYQEYDNCNYSMFHGSQRWLNKKELLEELEEAK